MGDYTFRLSLWITHPDADLSEVPGKLEMPAKVLWRKGDIWLAPKTGVRRPDRKSSYCNIELEQGAKNDLPAGLRRAIERLQPHTDYLAELHNRGIDLAFRVGWFSDWNSGDEFDWRILNDLASLHISLQLEFYGPDPVENLGDPPP